MVGILVGTPLSGGPRAARALVSWRWRVVPAKTCVRWRASTWNMNPCPAAHCQASVSDHSCSFREATESRGLERADGAERRLGGVGEPAGDCDEMTEALQERQAETRQSEADPTKTRGQDPGLPGPQPQPHRGLLAGGGDLPRQVGMHCQHAPWASSPTPRRPSESCTASPNTTPRNRNSTPFSGFNGMLNHTFSQHLPDDLEKLISVGRFLEKGRCAGVKSSLPGCRWISAGEHVYWGGSGGDGEQSFHHDEPVADG